MIHVFLIPQRFEDGVGKADIKIFCTVSLPRVMIDAEHLAFIQDLGQRSLMVGRCQIMSRGFSTMICDAVPHLDGNQSGSLQLFAQVMIRWAGWPDKTRDCWNAEFILDFV